MSLNLENSVKEIIARLREHKLSPAGELRVAERLVLAGLAVALEHQQSKNASLQSSQFLNLAYTVRQAADLLIARTAKDS